MLVLRSIFGFFRLAVLLLIAVVSLIFIFQKFFVADVLQQLLERKIGTAVTLQMASLNPLNGRITVKNLQVSNPDTFPQGPLATIPKIFLDLDLKAIRKKRFVIRHLTVNCKDVHIVKNADGEYNWFHLSTFSQDSNQKTSKKWFDSWPVQIDQYILSLGQASYADYSMPVPFKRSYPLKVDQYLYQDVKTMKEIIRIIAWETLIVLDATELAEAIRLIEKKIENKLGSRRGFMKEWHGVDPPDLMIEPVS